VKAARAGEGPQMVVANLLRLTGHGEHDDASYVADALKHAAVGRDCLDVAAELLIERGLASEEELAQMRRDAVAEVERVSKRVMREPNPEARDEDWQAISTKELIGSYEEQA